MSRVRDWLSFRNTCRNAIHLCAPKVVIGYDISALSHIPSRRSQFRTILHFHELFEKEKGMGIGTRLALSLAAMRSRRADLVVVADELRASEFQSSARLRIKPQVVMNCPRRLASVPSSVSDVAPSFGDTAICYLGSVGTNQGLIEAAASMRYWPQDSVFVLIGASSKAMQAKILAAADKLHTRIMFLGHRPHSQALALTAQSCLGLSLIQPNSKNLLYSAGAINKRFEYMALGLPQVTNNGPGVAKIVERNGCGICVDPDNSAEIGRTIAELLARPEKRREMGDAGRRMHLTDYNYEVQFKPIAEWIEAVCNRKDVLTERKTE